MGNSEIKVTYYDSGSEVTPNSDKYLYLPSFTDLYYNEKLPGLETKNAPVEIEIQEFYDNSVNLIVNDENSLRIINSGFYINKNKTAEEIIRNNNTNRYNENNVELNTSLILSSNMPPSIDYTITSGGNLMGGNYFFYIKYGTADGDVTNIVEESKVISIFHGDSAKTACGTLEDERTDKTIILKLDKLTKQFSRVYLYYTRYTSDTNGIKITKCYKIINGYNIEGKTYIEISITGDEEVEEISEEDLNINYFSIKSAKSIAQNQGMLFLAGITTDNIGFSKTLEDWSKDNIRLKSVVENIAGPDIEYDDNKDNNGLGYYNPKNISNNLGYWPEEFYRFGVVYVYKDGSTSNVYNLKGGLLNESGELITSSTVFENDYGVVYIKTPAEYYNNFLESRINFIRIYATISDTEKLKELEDFNITHFFIVRQPRIPVNIVQGIVNAVEDETGFPTLNFSGPKLYPKKDPDSGYDPFQFQITTEENNWVESFLTHPLDWWNDVGQFNFPTTSKDKQYASYYGYNRQCDLDFWHLKLIALKYLQYSRDTGINTNIDPSKYHYGILNLDSYCVNQLQSLFSANSFFVKPVGIYKNSIPVNPPEKSDLTSAANNSNKKIADKRRVLPTSFIAGEKDSIQAPIIYVPWDTPSIYYDGLRFSTRAGSAEDVLSVEYLQRPSKSIKNNQYNAAILRGNAVPFLGIAKNFTKEDYKLQINQLVTIRTIDFLEDTADHKTTIEQEINKRKQDKTYFNQICPRTKITYSEEEKKPEKLEIKLYGGDCFVNIVTIRMQSNFIDPEVQTNDTIVDAYSWQGAYKGINQTETTDKSKINRSDINASKIGTWYTFKCLSNYNLALRSEDKSHSEEISKMGNWRSFYPKRDRNITSAGKIQDSSLLNLGLSSVLSVRRYYNYTSEEIPFSNTDYRNRIAFSNKYIQGAFENGYRVFQGLSYHDYTREFGNITKIVSLGQSLFIVFDRGCAIAPINEKTLLNTTEGQSIHMYGAGVLPEQLTVVSQTYGSSWKESIITTPNGIYGVDTYNRVIWRYNQSNGFVVLSTMKVSSYLSSEIVFDEDEQFYNGLTQVRTHYNYSKKDVMFTFSSLKSKESEDKCIRNIWNLCWNELVGEFICKYTWYPYLSVNKGDHFYSFDMVNEKLLKEEKEEEDYLLTLFKYWKWKIDPNKENIEKPNFKKNPEKVFSLWESTKDLPTNWFGNPHPFELEFIVNNPLGLHKIFDNLVIISNNVEPESLEIEIIGDAYNFNKANICSNEKDKTFPKIEIAKSETTEDKKTYYTEVIEDENLKEYRLKVHQDALNIEEYGRRIGNLHYTEDKWNITLQPIYYEKDDTLRTTRIRDKYARIRIKYSGEKLVVITAIQTLFRLSYA